MEHDLARARNVDAASVAMIRTAARTHSSPITISTWDRLFPSSPLVLRSILPLTTVWAFTIWKSQGQTFTGKVVLNVSDHERDHGLTYVAFSHASRFSNIGLKRWHY
eukprot:scaffold130540_cov67-Attheya_sp.AAC.3